MPHVIGTEVVVWRGGANKSMFKMTAGMIQTIEECLDSGLYGASFAEAIERLIGAGAPEWAHESRVDGQKRLQR